MTDSWEDSIHDLAKNDELTLSNHLTVRDLLKQPSLQSAQILAGVGGQDVEIRRLNVMTVPEIVQWVELGEFLLTTGFPLRAHGELIRLVRELSDKGLAGLGVKFDSYLPAFTPDVLATADELDFPIVSIPTVNRFDDILSQAFETIINRQTAELSLSHRLHHTFLGLTFSGGDLESLMEELLELLEAQTAVVVDNHGAILTHAGNVGALEFLPGGVVGSATIDAHEGLEQGFHSHGGTNWVIGTMSAGAINLGHVIVVGVRGKSEAYATIATQQAAIVGTLEMMRDQEVRAVNGRFASNLLYELMNGDDLDGVSARAAAMDWALNRGIVVVTARPEHEKPMSTAAAGHSQAREQLTAERWSVACRRIDARAAAGVLGAQLVAVLGDGDELRDAVNALRSEMSKSAQQEFSLGVSRPHRGPEGIRVAYDEALRAMRLGPRVNGPHTVTHYDELGLFRLLAQMNDDELDSFVQDTLGPVFALPDPERSDLLQTLDALLANHLNIAQTAREVFFHYNTLRYRLAKLQKLLGDFGSDASTARRIGVALEIIRMRGRPSL